MFKLASRMIIAYLIACVVCSTPVNSTDNVDEPQPRIEPTVVRVSDAEIIGVEIEPEILEVEEILPNEDIELIALVTMAEAEGESEEGKRLVIDTILNRMDSGRWPDTAEGVIYQANQFTSMWNGRVDRCYVREDICQLVREELQSRTNSEVVFFRTGKYSSYGVPMFQVGNHYFSSYE